MMTAKLDHWDGKDSLRVYRNKCLIAMLHVDRTFYGPEWCANHGMKIVYDVTADNGETFDVWKSENLSCAIPRKGVD